MGSIDPQRPHRGDRIEFAGFAPPGPNRQSTVARLEVDQDKFEWVRRVLVKYCEQGRCFFAFPRKNRNAPNEFTRTNMSVTSLYDNFRSKTSIRSHLRCTRQSMLPQ